MAAITLYHGSTTKIEMPLTKVGRDDLDFGKGFYLTTYPEQAKQWAIRMKLIRRASSACVNVYELDTEAVIKEGFRILRLEHYDKQWLDFIAASRNGERPWKEYDLIEGGVANDKVIDTVEDYIHGTITMEQALGQLIYAKPNHQICILNQEIADKHLRFKTHYAID